MLNMNAVELTLRDGLDGAHTERIKYSIVIKLVVLNVIYLTSNRKGAQLGIITS